jgi:hypothetical protein
MTGKHRAALLMPGQKLTIRYLLLLAPLHRAGCRPDVVFVDDPAVGTCS